MRNSHKTYPSFWQAVVLFIVPLFIIEILAHLFFKEFLKDATHSFIFYFVSYILTLGIAYFIKKTRKESFSVSFKIGDWEIIPMMVLTMLFLYLFAIIGFSFLVSAFPYLAQKISPEGSFIEIAILVPVLEELIFRGLFLGSFLKRYSLRRAILYSAILFSALHLYLLAFPFFLLLGCIFGWVYFRTGSVFHTIIGHASYNSFALLAFYLGSHYPALNVCLIEKASSNFKDILILVTVFIASLVLLVICLWRLKIIFNRKVNPENMVDEPCQCLER